jgi:hypothetical protein
MEVIYEVRRSDGLRWYGVHTNFLMSTPLASLNIQLKKRELEYMTSV